MKSITQILNILRIENIELYHQYEIKKQLIQRKNGQSNVNELFLWHGTKQVDPMLIASEGFDFRVGKEGCSFGKVCFIVLFVYIFLLSFIITIIDSLYFHSLITESI